MAPFSLTLPTHPRMVTVARAFVEAVCQSCDLDRVTTHAIVLASSEAISNIVRHAHRDRPEASMQIICRPGPDCLELQFLDEGEPFDLEAVPFMDPTELRIGGRGVFLMRSLMDELCCTPRPTRGNLLRMVKRWSTSVRECG
jgi:serine/threonine-protein kinase RsbW